MAERSVLAIEPAPAEFTPVWACEPSDDDSEDALLNSATHFNNKFLLTVLKVEDDLSVPVASASERFECWMAAGSGPTLAASRLPCPLARGEGATSS